MLDDLEILEEFIVESKKIIKDSLFILDKVEGNIVQANLIKDYGNLVDRLMGGAKSLATLLPSGHSIILLGDYACLCKAVSYKTSQIKTNEQFFNICVALLQDATETLEIMITNLDKSPAELHKLFSIVFIERLRWISNKFNIEYVESLSSSSKKGKQLVQSEIDSMLKKIGF